MKILYAASNRPGAKLQLTRFLQHINPTYTIKIAGYQDMNMYLDWTLDALKDIFNPNRVSLENDNYEIYASQIKAYAPDLIISDLEYYTSYAGQQLDIEVWQVSPLLVYSGFSDNELDLFVKYKQFLITYNKILKNTIFNSNRRFMYSYLCDIEGLPKSKEGYEWVRSYSQIGKISTACHHNIVAALHKNNKQIAKILNELDDVVVFSDKQFDTMITKSTYDIDEYSCNIKNCNYLINQGLTDLLADAFYNNKPSIIVPDLFDCEAIINTLFSEHFRLNKVSYDGVIYDGDEVKAANIATNENVKLLHEYIDDFANA